MTDPYRGEEVVLAHEPHLFRWRGPKAGFTLFGTVLGELVITSRRVVFVSSGEDGLGGQFRVLADKVGIAAGATPARELDLRGLGQKGSLEVPLDRVREVAVRRRLDLASYLSIRFVGADGAEDATAFMSKLGLNRGALEVLARACQEARARAM